MVAVFKSVENYVNEDAVSLIEDTLELAKSGEVIAVAIIQVRKSADCRDGYM